MPIWVELLPVELIQSAGFARNQKSEVRSRRSVSGDQKIRKPSGSAIMAPSILPTALLFAAREVNVKQLLAKAS